MEESKDLYNELIDQFDLKDGDTVLISSDINRLALVFKNKGIPFKPDIFIEKLQESIPKGTIIIPAYTDTIKDGELFDRQLTKPTTGAISNRVMKRKDFMRTSDPIHSVFVWGKRSDEILSLEDQSTFGVNSIFGFLDRIHGKMVIIDVHFNNSFTFVHYIEEKMKVKFRKPYVMNVQIKDYNITNSKSVIFYTKKPGFLVDLNDFQNELIQKGIVSDSVFHGIHIMHMDLHVAGREIENYLKKGKKTYSFSLKHYLKQIIRKMIGKK